MDGAREHRIFHDVSWREFERRLAAKHEQRTPLFAYLDGTLELMSPSYDHDLITRNIEHLLVEYAIDHDVVAMTCAGSWTIKNKLKKAGLEPDNCYLFGPRPRGRKRPDLAVEVAWSRGGIAKLEIYRRLGVLEVWYWRRDAIEVYTLRKTGYHRVERSRFFPRLDLARVCTLLHLQFLDTVRAYRADRAAFHLPPARRTKKRPR